MTPYYKLDIATIYLSCNDTLEVLKATQIFKDLAEEGEDINLDFVRTASNMRVRQMTFGE